jgi:hypothetical protein
MRFLLAIRAFFRVLANRGTAARIAEVLNGPLPALPKIEEPRVREPGKREPPAKVIGRSEAITLLATLQREARLVDALKEPLSGYSDAQIGAAARDVFRDCGAVLERLFGLRPLSDQAEGTQIEVPVRYDAGRFRLTGHVEGEPPFRGTLAHHGWVATRCEVPQWSGSGASSFVVAPMEVDLKSES